MQTILVQMANLKWTTQALHLACALARNGHSRIVLLRLIEVQHLRTLGSSYANVPLSPQEYRNLTEYNATAEDYGVELSVAQMQCVAPLGAVVQAAQHINADIIFVNVPESRIPFLRQFRLWQLQRQFAAAQQQFFTLDTPQHEIVQPATTTATAPAEPAVESSEPEHIPLDTF